MVKKEKEKIETKSNEINKSELNDVISLGKKILQISYIVFIAGLVLAVILICQKVRILSILLDILKVISPFFIGFIVAWLLRPLVKKLNEKVKSYTLCSFIVFSIFILVIFLILYIFIPTLYNEVNDLVGLLPSFVERITERINDLFLKFNNLDYDLTEFKTNLIANISSYSTNIAKDIPNNIIGFIGSLFSGIGTVAMGLIIGIYMLIDYDGVMNHFHNLFPKKVRKDVIVLTDRIGNEVRKCVNGTFLVALMVLVCDSIGFALVGLNAPVLFGMFCGITDLIPFIGPYLGGAAAVIVGLTQDPLIGIGVLIICVLVQIIESYILQPIVMSKASNLHPIIIIIGLLVFGHFFGIIGMILATPVITICRVIIEFTMEKVKEKKKM